MKGSLKKMLSLVLTLCMAISLFPAAVWAEANCTHQHDASCGYVAAEKEKSCTHKCTADCYVEETKCVHEHGEDCYVSNLICENVEEEHEHSAECYGKELACGHECSLETGCVTQVCQHEHDADCGYAPAVAGSPCTHQHDASCGGLVTEKQPEEQPTAVEKLQERIDDLPDADALADMTEEELQEVSDEIGEIMDAIEETGEDGLKLDGLYALQAAFLALAAAVPAPLVEDEEPLPEGTLDIGKGSVLITDTGYTQGTLKFENTKGFSILDAAGNKIEETLWSDGEHALTIVGSSIGVNEATSTSTIVIAGGTPTITLKEVAIQKNSGGEDTSTPAIVLLSGANSANKKTATIQLEGDNYLTAGNGAPAVQINSNAEMTITGEGTLTVQGRGNGPGIGAGIGSKYAINPARNTQENGFRGNGNLILEDCTVVSIGSGSAAGAAGLGRSSGATFGKITIDNADVTTKNVNNGAGVRCNHLEIKGGSLMVEPTSGKTIGIYLENNGSYAMEGGTLTFRENNKTTIQRGSGVTFSITGGNINGYYTGEEQNSRVLTKLYFAAADGTPLANTEVSVTEGDHTWTALTDEKGIITTYLASDTEAINAEVNETEYEDISVDTKHHTAVIGGDCTCKDGGGALTMTTASQSLTTVNDQAELTLEAVYQNKNCKLPDGFHGAYEDISYEITKVLRNGKPVRVESYASIEGNILNVYGDVNQDGYVVFVRAISGPEGASVTSEPIQVAVGTYVSVATDGEFDIALGDIVVTAGTGENAGKTVYTQGDKTQAVDSDTPVTITGSSITVGENSTANMIIIQSGNANILLDNVTIQKDGTVAADNNAPAILLYGGDTADLAAKATITLVGTNNLTSGKFAPAIQINQNATLTIVGDGILNAKVGTGSGNTPGIGCAYNATYAYGNKNNSAAAMNGNYRANGNLIIQGGTINATGNGAGTSGKVAGIGTSYYAEFGTITITGGMVNAMNNTSGRGLSAKKIVIEGGEISTTAVTPRNAQIYGEESFTMSGGTIVQSNGIELGAGNKPSITGGNVNSYYSGAEQNNRVLTKLYFVEEDGTPLANREVSVTEGDHTWTALTDVNGVITTYLAAGTASIKATVGETTYENIPVIRNAALIGGECSCNSFSGITWTPGVPASVTLYGEENSIYTLADAELVVEGKCSMPIHPNLAKIAYSLSVTTQEGSVVEESEVVNYATLENGTLTLKPSNAPYTVTLTATADEHTITHTVEVTKGTADIGEMTVIDLSKGDVTIAYNAEGSSYTYTQGETSVECTGNITLTGNAANATVTINGGNPNLVLNQNNASNVWNIVADGAAMDATAVSGTVYFGTANAKQVLLSCIAADGIKLNAENGDITLGADAVKQGAYSVKGVKDCTVVGASTEKEISVTNSTSGQQVLTINGESVSLAANEAYAIAKAVAVQDDKDGTTRSYLMPITDGYRLVVAGSGSTAGMGNYITEYEDQQRAISDYWFDPEIEELSGSLLYRSAITDVSIDDAKIVNGIFYNCNVENIHFGAQAEKITIGKYTGKLQNITVDPNNENYKTQDGVLYSKDGAELICVPSKKTGEYKVLSTCITIGGSAFYGTYLTSVTFGPNVTNIFGSVFEDAQNLQAVNIDAGNLSYKSIDGVLFNRAGTSLIYYPVAKRDAAYEVPKGVTNIAAFAVYQNRFLTELTLPEGTVTLVDHALSDNFNLEKLTVLGGLNGGNGLSGSHQLNTMTVSEDYNWAGKYFNDRNNHGASPMKWIADSGITVSGGDCVYDGQPHSITVNTKANDVTVEYLNEETGEYTTEAPAFTASGTYTVSFRLTKAEDVLTDDDKTFVRTIFATSSATHDVTKGEVEGRYEFERTVYGSKTFTISETPLEQASADWFDFVSSRTSDDTSITSGAAVSIAVPGVSLTEGGYEVQYYKDGTLLGDIPTEAGTYVVKVKITAEGYEKETIELGTYVIAESGKVVISFVTNGGTEIAPITGAAGSTITETIATERTGYQFLGWYTDASLRTKTDLPTTMPSESVTYYAKWQREEYAITYTWEGIHEGAVVTNNNPALYDIEDSFTLVSPSCDGYVFKTWRMNGLDINTVTFAGKTKGNLELTGVFEKITYRITTNDADITVPQDTYTVKDTLSGGITLTVPTEGIRPNYTFMGWQMRNDNKTTLIWKADTEDAKIPQGTLGDIELSGIWLADDQTLTLNANGGKFADGNDTFTLTREYESAIGNLSEPAREGYEFRGWYENEDCTTPFNATTMPTDTTIYAKWIQKCAVTFNTNGGTFADGTASKTQEGYVGETQIAYETPSRSKYRFLGWYDSDGNPYTLETMTGDVALHAEWKKKSSSPTSTSSGSSSTDKTYSVSVEDTEYGTVKASSSKVEKNEKVTITVTPDKGYEINKVTVKDANGNKIELKDQGNGKYTFTMPASKVEVKATFSKGEEPVVEEVKSIILKINERLASVFGEPVMNDVAPVIRNDRTMLPIRFVAEALDGSVAWNGELQKVTITKGELVIEIYINQPFALVNGTPVQLDAPAFIENNRTYLPLRFVAENLGATVTWNAETQEVTITPINKCR